MAKLQIVHWPDPRLLAKTAPITEFTDDVRDRIQQMFALMYAEGGVGLAAPQVGWSVRLFLSNPTGNPAEKDQEAIYMNPRILRRKGRITGPEGCLSFPEVYVEVERSKRIVVEYQDENLEKQQVLLEDFPARVFQHELDHLDNVLLVDRMTEADKIRTKDDIEELRRSYQAIS